MPAVKSKLLTTGQAARLCSVTPDAVLKWIKKGQLSGVRTAGGHYRINRRDIEPLMAPSLPGEGSCPQTRERPARNLRCWEYLGQGGAMRESCRRCVVYRVRAAACFLVAGLEPEVGHARQFCQTSCEDCVYYRRVKGLPTNVLVVTPDDELIDRLRGDQNEGISLRFARNAYDTSAIVHEFRPAFVVIDVESLPPGDTQLLDSLAADSRVPGLRVIVMVERGTAGRKRGWPKNDLVVSVLEKPFSSRRIAAMLNSFPVDLLATEDADREATAGKDQR